MAAHMVATDAVSWSNQNHRLAKKRPLLSARNVYSGGRTKARTPFMNMALLTKGVRAVVTAYVL